ncbi:hypothetical protein MTR_7g013880 [Medicago truncatula]|nr:hypothetical protein MTR_7g013880 [Medicago truncatula]
MGKDMRVGYGDGEGKTRPRPLPCLALMRVKKWVIVILGGCTKRCILLDGLFAKIYVEESERNCNGFGMILMEQQL